MTITRFSFKNFDNAKQLLQLKESQGVTIGVCLPVLNEAKALGKIIKTVQGCRPLVDEIVAIDSGSTDKSAEICKGYGIQVVGDQEAAQELGVRLVRGKGFNLWASLHYLKTDIIAWTDTDITNFGKRFVFGTVGPLLANQRLEFVKGFYQRPKGDSRVTEILVRPYASQIFPEITEFVQPLSGEYGGRRKFLETLNFYSGYSVEIALLLQARLKLSEDQIGQVFLGKRFHDLQSVASLGVMSASILRTLFDLSLRYGRIDYQPQPYSDFLYRFSGTTLESYRLETLNIRDEPLPPMRSYESTPDQTLLSA